MDRNASSETNIQMDMDQVSQPCDNFDLTINTKNDRGYTQTSTWKFVH